MNKTLSLSRGLEYLAGTKGGIVVVVTMKRGEAETARRVGPPP